MMRVFISTSCNLYSFVSPLPSCVYIRESATESAIESVPVRESVTESVFQLFHALLKTGLHTLCIYLDGILPGKTRLTISFSSSNGAHHAFDGKIGQRIGVHHLADLIHGSFVSDKVVM